MDWNKLILMLVVLAIYIPMVFMGSNTFFPEYSNSDRPFKECFGPRAVPVEETTVEKEMQQQCLEEERASLKEWEAEKRKNDAKKYIFVLVVNIIALLAIFFISVPESVTLGIFLGAALVTAFSTMAWFDTRSRVGFGLVVLIFIGVITFIIKKKVFFVQKKRRK